MRLRFLRAQALLDMVTLIVSMLVASVISFDTVFPWQFEPQIWSLLMIMLAGLAGAEWVGSRLLVGGPTRPGYGRALAVTLMVVGVTALALVATRVYFSRSFIGWTVACFVLGAITHRAWLRRRPWTEAMVLITGEQSLVDDLRNAPHADVISVVDPATEARLDPLEPGVVLGVDLKAALSRRMAQYVSSCALAGLDVRPISQVYEMYTGRMPIVALVEGWELSTPVIRTAPYLPGKRLFDILVVLLTAPITLVLAGVTAAVTRLSSPGPVIYRQIRVGRGGGHFTQYKFRSMWHDPDRKGASFTSPDDDRVVPAARTIRRYRLDELPQLWNVLKGDLSLVGPRPEQVEFVKRFDRTIPFYSQRHLVRPGCTGWAQVNHGYADGEAGTVEKLTYDLFYVKHMSPWLDLEILGRSFWTLLSGFGAR
ncbi:MAG: sugar transferase [bacterium]|nr:sugar transferase [bacterium]